MKVVVDTSIAIKWFVEEPRRSEARSLLESDRELMAPEFAFAEVASVLWRKVRMGQATIEQARSAVGELPSMVKLVSPSTDIMQAALGLAAELEHSVYDCIFLAMALKDSDAVLVTDDSVFADKVASAGYGDKIRRLADEPIRPAFSEEEFARLQREAGEDD